MARPAVIFDRDNTLIVNDGYLGDASGVVLMPGAADAVARAQRLGYAVVVVSNQSGVARGLFDEAAVRAVDRRMADLLLKGDPAATVDLHLYCPYHPRAVVPAYRRDSDDRKPKAGMIRRAAAELSLDLPASWLIGDAPRDVAAGRAAGCRTVLFTPPGVPASAATRDAGGPAEFRVESLAAAIALVEKHGLYR